MVCEIFAHYFAQCENQLEVCEIGTRVPGDDFAQCENFRTFHSGVRNWILGNSHLENGFRTLKLISHLEVGVCEIDLFWPKDFAPWFWGVRNFRTLKSGVRNFGTLKSGALLPWFYSPVLLLKSSPHFS